MVNFANTIFLQGQNAASLLHARELQRFSVGLEFGSFKAEARVESMQRSVAPVSKRASDEAAGNAGTPPLAYRKPESNPT